MIFPAGRRYSFEVTIDIGDELSFVPGELGTYLADGLYELDRTNLLFPGLKTPMFGERLLGVACHQTGYEHRPATSQDTKPDIIEAVGSEEQQALLSDLEGAVLRVSDMLRDLRLIKAKADATLENLGANLVWTKTETQRVEALVDALDAVTKVHVRYIAPLL